MDGSFWMQKLMAFLHDPPCKPLDIVGHEKVGEGFIRQAGLNPDEMDVFHRQCDLTAAAADRFPFPDPSFLRSSFLGVGDTPFRHPLGGSDYAFSEPFPSPMAAEEILQVIQTGLAADQVPAADHDWANFFLHWRRWPIESARRDSRTYFLPADTRMPDHSVWTHNSVVSALQGCVANGLLRPAFLLFQLGPVQAFIEQARSTRDLWSGSYLIAWLVCHALKAVTDKVGPDAVIFPALRGQPLFDLLHRDRLYRHPRFASGDGRMETLWQRMKVSDEAILTPNLPNRFLALVPEEDAADFACRADLAVHEELKRIAEASWNWLHSRLPLDAAWQTRYDAQVEGFAQTTWQAFPWGQEDVDANLAAFDDLCPYQESPAQRLREIHALATVGIPYGARDRRYFTDSARTRLNNPGFCWPYFYTMADWLHAARRNTRNFKAWHTDPYQSGSVKDSFSGIEEVIGSENWWVEARTRLRYLFRSDDRLGAMNLIKRVWHRAYLEKEWELDVNSALRFESVPGVAAGSWRQRLQERVRRDPAVYSKVSRAKETILRHAEESGLPSAPDQELGAWIQKTDPIAFVVSSWERTEAGGAGPGQEVVQTLRELYACTGQTRAIAPPPTYYAVIAFDGDEMGKWVSGEKTPELLGQLSRSAAEYLEYKASDSVSGLRRPLSPSYHLQFSESLANFGLYLARPIVTYFGGQLIYSGGDDVLAMVPATSALDCAEALYAAFRGQRRLLYLVEDVFDIRGTEGGFVQLKHPSAEEPNWPLIVPGPAAEASAGVSIGHVRASLQEMVRGARDAERRAKNAAGRSACSVSLHKRSGEILEWEFKWSSGALDLYRMFSSLSSGDQPLLPGRFGYALNGLLAPYQSGNRAGSAILQDDDLLRVNDVIRTELAHVLSRQGRRLREEKPQQFQQFVAACEFYLESLRRDGRQCLIDFPMLFNVANFVTRGEE